MFTKTKGRSVATEPAQENTHIKNDTPTSSDKHPKLKLKGKRNQCCSCGKGFNSLSAFEKHRLGNFGIDRRCATTDGMLEMGMFLPDIGFWVSERMTNAIPSPDGRGKQAIKNVGHGFVCPAKKNVPNLSLGGGDGH